MPSDSYRNQTTNNFKKLLDQEDVENISMITVSILLVLCIYIGPTRLWEDGAPNAEFEADGRFYPGSTNLNWDDNAIIGEAIAANKDNKDEDEDS